MKQPIRFFSIGIFIASILLYGFYFFFHNDPQDNSDLSVEDLITEIEAEGYRVITEADYVSFSLSQEQNNDEADEKDATDDVEKEDTEEKDSEAKKDEQVDEKEEKEKKGDKEETPEEVITHTFETTAGVVSQDIGDILIEHRIIDDRQAFLDYLHDNDYSAFIQLGTFTVTSDMSYKEIAEIITTYPGN